LEKQSTTPITDAEAASLAASESSQQTTFAKHQSLPMVRSVLLAALVCAAPIRLCLAQEAQVSVDMMGIGSLSCAHWQSTQAHRVEGTIWIYGFWTGLNYVASASEQTETKVDTAAAMAEVKKTCAQRPSQVLASAAWTAYLALHKR
jgi:redox-regulated HSP33 family molecular chaperone